MSSINDIENRVKNLTIDDKKNTYIIDGVNYNERTFYIEFQKVINRNITNKQNRKIIFREGR
jgi:hypothetical protein